MNKILVTGSNGQLGSEIKELSSGYPYSFHFTDKKELDISNLQDVRKYIIENNIDTIINCAAYTAVDKAESEQELANKINHQAVQNLTMLSNEFGIKLIHISTDYVFDGTNFKPYSEEDNTNPQSAYGTTKLDGEKVTLEYNLKNSIIIRTSWVYSSFGNNFVKTMLRLGKEKNELSVIYDQVGTPTYARDLAEAILDIVPKIKNNKVEIYNYSNEGVLSWYDFAKEIMKMAKLNCEIHPIETKEYPTSAKRPHYSLLNKSKIKSTFNIEIPYWKDGLDDCLKRLGETKIVKSILLTGTAGFIGSNFVPYFLEKYPEYNLINLDLLTYAGNLENLKECEGNPRYKFIKGNICNRELVEFIFNEYDIRGVIHFAAESHVDNSIKNPGVFVETNVNGTFTLVDVAQKYWMDKPFTYKKEYTNCRFHHISTDEVYGTLNETDLFTEETPYAPNSPYSASKASSDMIVRSYQETYGMNTVITNCSNNYGPKQHDEKLIPTIIRKALAGEAIPIYGDGKNIRDWLYVLDHCKGIDLVYHAGKEGNVYNIGGRNERTNLQIVGTITTILNEKVPPQQNIGKESYKELITFMEDRAGHDRRYAIDATKLETQLRWKADENFETGIVKTVEWYLEKYKNEN